MAMPKEHFGYAFVGATSGKILERANMSIFYEDQSAIVKSNLGITKSHVPNVTMLLYNSLFDNVDLTDNVIELSEKKDLFTRRIPDALEVKLYFACDDEKPYLRDLTDLKGDMASYIHSIRKHYYEIPFITSDDLVDAGEYKAIIERVDLYNPFVGIIRMVQKLGNLSITSSVMDLKEAKDSGLEDIYNLMLNYEFLENQKELGLNASQIKDIISYISFVISENTHLLDERDVEILKDDYKSYVNAISDIARPLSDEHKKAIVTYMNKLLRLKSKALKPLNKSVEGEYNALLDRILGYLEINLKRITRYYDDNDDIDVSKIDKKERIKRVVDRYNRLLRDGSVQIDESKVEYAIMLSKYVNEYNKIFRRQKDAEKGTQRLR